MSSAVSIWEVVIHGIVVVIVIPAHLLEGLQVWRVAHIAAICA